MTPEQVEEKLIALKHRKPFVPFVVEMTSGEELEIGTPGLSICGGGAGFTGPDGGLVDFEFKNVCSIRLIHSSGEAMNLRGRVENGVVVLDDGADLRDGTLVAVWPMSSAAQISSAVPAPTSTGLKGHSILDIPPISLGPVLRPFTDGDDLLGEMLENRR